jgi:hypothetical protein
MLRKTPKNSLEKIGESYQHRNVFNVSIENPGGTKSGNRHKHVLTLPH